jgi:hypothetical protein
MEEKLDQVIKLLEQQNQAIERLIRLQTTNNFSKQHSPRSMVGREGMPDVKSMIEEARAKAMAKVNKTKG